MFTVKLSTLVSLSFRMQQLGLISVQTDCVVLVSFPDNSVVLERDLQAVLHVRKYGNGTKAQSGSGSRTRSVATKFTDFFFIKFL